MSNRWRLGVRPGFFILTVALAMGSGCNASSNGSSDKDSAQNPPGSIRTSDTLPGGGTGTPPANGRTYTTAVLLYQGSGAASVDVQSLESILTSAKISYAAKTSAQMNALTAADYDRYGMLLVPGGTAKTMSDSLTSKTRQLIHDAVADDGMGYMGICAGAFLAGDYGSWGLALAPYNFDYYIAEYQGVVRSAVDIRFPDGSPNGNLMNLIWYGGPKLDGFGSVIGRYPDNTVALAQDEVGKGFVMLSAVHPEAPAVWRSGTGITDTMEQDFAYTLMLIQATLNRRPLPTF